MTFANVFQDLVAFVERWVSEAHVIDWVLIGAGVAVLWIAWRLLASEVRLGTVEVSSDEAGSLDNKQIAELREELANAGLLPAGGIPAGAPKANLVAAIEKAPVPEAPWLAALANLVPSLPAYRSFEVSATLRDGLGEKKNEVGVTYQVAQQQSRMSLGIRTARAGTAQEAIKKAADQVYRRIAASAPAIFPGWSVWPNERSLAEYRAGTEFEKAGQPEAAFECFKVAATFAPRNMLARLCVANRLERNVGGSPTEETRRRVAALGEYLAIAELEPSIYQAHYRAMVLLSVLADTWSSDDAAADRDLRRALKRRRVELPPAEDLEAVKSALRAAAVKESRTADRRLGISWTVLHEGRLRHRFELKGEARRRADKALATSRLSIRVRRQWLGDGEIPWGRSSARRYWWRTRMRLRHAFMREAIGWQAHYNAACFYALLPETTADPALSDSDWLQNRAFRHLARAFGDPTAGLDEEYVRHDDPDLEPLRRERHRWREKMDAIIGPEAVIHYHRPGDAVDDLWNWGLHLWGEGVRPSARTAWEHPREPGRITGHHAEYWVPVGDDREPIRFLIHAGERKDGGDRRLDVRSEGLTEVWVVAGDSRAYTERPDGFPGVSDSDAKAVAEALPGATKPSAGDRVEYSVDGQVFVSLARDHRTMRCLCPPASGAPAVADDPLKVTKTHDSATQKDWLLVKMGAVDADELRQLVTAAWRTVRETSPTGGAAARGDEH